MASTTYTEEIAVAGMEVTSVPLVSMIYDGLSNWGLRFVASGQRGYFVMSRTYRESNLLYSIIAGLKECDLEMLISQFSRSRDIPYGTADEKKTATKKFADHIVEYMTTLGPQHAQASLTTRIKELEAENARMANQQQKPAGPVAVQIVQASDDVYKDLRKKTDQDRYLGKTAPTSHKARDINAWIKKTPAKKPDVDSGVNHYNSIYDARTGDQKNGDLESLRAAAVEWGLPFTSTGAYDAKSLIKVLTVVKVVHQQA